MSNAANDSISLDDLIAAVGGSGPEGSGSSSSAGKASKAGALRGEPAPSIDLLSALGLESLPDENARPVFYSEREERERKREAQRREQQIRSQQWQRELREIEARKARIEAERPVASPEVDKNVVETVPSAAAQRSIDEQAAAQRPARAPRFEPLVIEQQPVPTPGFMDEQPQQVSSVAPAQSAPLPTVASPVADRTEDPSQPSRSDAPAQESAPIRHASFSSLPQRRAFIAPLQAEPVHDAGSHEEPEAPATTAWQPIEPIAEEPSSEPVWASSLTRSEPVAVPEEGASANGLAAAASPEAAPRRASFSDYRAGQVSITPLGAIEQSQPAEEPSVLESANIQLAQEKSTAILSHLITQDHSQAFIEPSEAMNTPVAPSPMPWEKEADELPEEPCEEAVPSDNEPFDSAEAEEERYGFDEGDALEEGIEEEPDEGAYITRRSFPASDTSSFSAIEPDLRMPGEPEAPSSPFGQPSGVLPPLSGGVLENISSMPSIEEADITAETAVTGQGYSYAEEDESLSLEEPQTMPSAVYQAPAPEPAFLQGSAEPTRKPTLRQVEPAFDEEGAARGSRSRIIGIVLIVVAVLCAIFAIVLVSGALNLGGLFGPSAEEEGSSDEPPALVYEATGADTASYSYVVRGPDGSTHEATEEAVFDEDGVLIESTISVDVDSQETADKLLEQLRDEFGDSVMDYKTSDSKVIIVLDIERDDLTKEIYTELLSANMAEFKVVS